MKSFIIKVFIVAICLFVFDRFLGSIFDRLFTDLPSRQSETSTIYNSLFPNEDVGILVLGSSTANHNYNTRIFTDSIGLLAYNAGLDGHDLAYSDMVFESFLSKTSLQYVIVDIGMPNIDGQWKGRLGKVKQYYGRNRFVTDYFDEETDWKQRLKLNCNTYRYNGTMHSVISILFFERPADTLYGFRPLEGTHAFNYQDVRGFAPDEDLLKHLTNIVQKCSENSIQLIIVKSPCCVDNLDFNIWLETFGCEHKVLTIMENKNLFWKEHPELYYDGNHLNSEGANILSNRVCERIKQIIK